MTASDSRLRLAVSSDTLFAGKYRLGRTIASGGMGVILEARHRQLGHRVAIKLLLPQAGATDDDKARFLREGRAAARIGSDHVVRVTDVGVLLDGTPYMV